MICTVCGAEACPHVDPESLDAERDDLARRADKVARVVYAMAEEAIRVRDQHRHALDQSDRGTLGTPEDLIRIGWLSPGMAKEILSERDAMREAIRRCHVAMAFGSLSAGEHRDVFVILNSVLPSDRTDPR